MKKILDLLVLLKSNGCPEMTSPPPSVSQGRRDWKKSSFIFFVFKLRETVFFLITSNTKCRWPLISGWSSGRSCTWFWSLLLHLKKSFHYLLYYISQKNEVFIYLDFRAEWRILQCLLASSSALPRIVNRLGKTASRLQWGHTRLMGQTLEREKKSIVYKWLYFNIVRK